MAASGLAVSMPRLFQEPSAKPVGWAILGLGGYATNQILPNMKFCKLSKPVALISGTPAKLERLGAEYGIDAKNRYTYDQMDAIKDNPEIEVVYIITPPGTHRDFTLRAANLGKHVCCEKPMANSVAECQEMIDACKKAGKLLQIGYRSHYEPHNLRAIEMCRKGELGVLRSISTSMGFSMGRGSWRLEKKRGGGGSMYDIGIYGVQALRYLSGEEPTEVYATISNPPGDDRFKEVEDTVHYTFKFPSGLHAMGSSSYSWTGVNRYEVLGTRGRLTAENATGYGGHNFQTRQPITPNPGNQWASQMDHLSDCIRTGAKTNKTPGEMGLQDIKIIHAIYESAKTGKPVKL
ncbi:MAG: Gfo/Idh/MocA family oxidoreductase [Chlorobia bacterium]|nr:Gfo/Idh/MocA family oxidoreductase [Fimbriimonadaceae bacterium]